MKKVDPIGSLRLSADYVGSTRREAGSSPPSSANHKRSKSETGKAGKAIVDEIVLPTLQKVIFTKT